MAKNPDIEIPAPRENPHLFGHAAAEAQFKQEFDGGKLHHAYLMTGPKGIGKATLAYRFARHILATGAVKQAAPEADSFSLFGEAPVPAAPVVDDEAMFRRIAAGSHTDLLTIAPAYDKKKDMEKSTISVEEARKVPEFLSLTPAEGDWRVVIVDAVDQLNTNAANALLKILEEPPERAILLLVCHEPGAILPTILSRCRRFVLNAPSRADFDKALSAVAPAIERSDYGALYGLSNGSPGLAITLYAQNGLKLYQSWLGALQPDAGAVRQKFIDLVANQKTPDAWRTLMHGWQTAITRITLWPHPAGEAIVKDEAEQIAAIAQSVPAADRLAWAGRAQRLISQTETFNLDKRQTIAMLLQPGLLDSVAA